MKFNLCFVPPGGGDQDFAGVVVDAQRVPDAGEYIHLLQRDAVGASFFRVLLVGTTYTESASKEGTYSEGDVIVQAEYIEGPEALMSDRHRAVVDAYKKRGLAVQREPRSGS
ncbi:MAG TPA: hypothetical protein VNF75_09185 [Candidatus Dormibacteraeota bacterium]|nr:hypothetical protein [Candidatus Dormibacteraeota bacterium]